MPFDNNISHNSKISDLYIIRIFRYFDSGRERMKVQENVDDVMSGFL